MRNAYKKYLHLAFKPPEVPMWNAVVRCRFSHDGEQKTEHIVLTAYMGKDIQTTVRAIFRNTRRLIKECKLLREYGIHSEKAINSLKLEIVEPECLVGF